MRVIVGCALLALGMVSAGCSSAPQGVAEAPQTAAETRQPAAETQQVGGEPAQAPARVEERTLPPARLPAGTLLRVRLAQALDTSRNRAGDRFEASLAAPIRHGGRVVLPKHTLVRGHITASKPAGRLRGRGYLGLTLDSVLVNGRSYRLATSRRTLATGSHKKRNLALIGGGSGLGALIGGIAGGGKGALIGAGSGAAAGTAGAALTGRKNVHLPAESLMTFSLRAPLVLEAAGTGSS